jgi:hypothetical protein
MKPTLVIFLLFSQVVVPVLNSRDGKNHPMIVFWPSEANDYPLRVPIGSGHDAVFYTLAMYSMEAGHSLQVVDHSADWPVIGENREDQFDVHYRIRWTSLKDQARQSEYYFFFRRGFLIAKCPSSIADALPTRTFAKEITSGLHHPPNYPDLLSHVTWGTPTGHQVWKQDGKDNIPPWDNGLHSPRLRCGIALKNLPPFARRNKLNVLVLVQNVDAEALSIKVPWQDMVVGSVRLAAFEKGSNDNARSVVVGGTNLTLLNSGVPGRFHFDDMRLASMELQPSQCDWFWFRSTVFGDPRLVLRAHVQLLGVNAENRVCEYRLSCEVASTLVSSLVSP